MRFEFARRLAAAAALVLLSGAPASAQVPDPFARELARQLAQADALLGQHGYSRVAGPFAGGLQQRATRRIPLTLRAGQDYSIAGFCDTHCRDIDLRVYDENNQLLGEDALTDDVPMVNVQPKFTGSYSVEVVMYQCNASPCYYAFNVYARRYAR